MRFFGTVASGVNVVGPGLTVGPKDRTWAADVVPGSSPAQGTSTIYSAVNGSSVGTTSLKNVRWFTAASAQTMSYDYDGNLVSDGVFRGAIRRLAAS